MKRRLRILICLAAVAFLGAACSSTTVVARDERATSSADGSAQPTDDSDPDTADATNAGDQDDTDAADDEGDEGDEGEGDEGDEGRGGRDDSLSAQDVDIAEGFGLGGAEQMQGLLVDCQDGNDLACDILFQISAFDSEEETAARNCGGRSDVDVAFCTAGIDAGSDDLVFDPASDGLERIIEACQVDGNMTACDFLYYRSPIDSEFQEIGGTCGGRVNVAVPDCRSIIDE